MVPARSRGRTLPRSRGLAFVPFVVARAGGSIHFALFRRGKGLRSNDERSGKVQESTFSDDRQQLLEPLSFRLLLPINSAIGSKKGSKHGGGVLCRA